MRNLLTFCATTTICNGFDFSIKKLTWYNDGLLLIHDVVLWNRH